MIGGEQFDVGKLPPGFDLAAHIASVIDTDACFPNDETSNGEAKGIEDEGKIKIMKARSNKRAANRRDHLARAALMCGPRSNCGDGTIVRSPDVDTLLETEPMRALEPGR